MDISGCSSDQLGSLPSIMALPIADRTVAGLISLLHLEVPSGQEAVCLVVLLDVVEQVAVNYCGARPIVAAAVEDRLIVSFLQKHLSTG